MTKREFLQKHKIHVYKPKFDLDSYADMKFRLGWYHILHMTEIIANEKDNEENEDDI